MKSFNYHAILYKCCLTFTCILFFLLYSYGLRAQCNDQWLHYPMGSDYSSNVCTNPLQCSTGNGSRPAPTSYCLDGGSLCYEAGSSCAQRINVGDANCTAPWDGSSYTDSGTGINFTFTVTPSGTGTFDSFSFYEYVPPVGLNGTNFGPQQFGVAVWANGTKVFEQIDQPTSFTSWTLQSFNVNHSFTVTTTFDVYIYAYDPIDPAGAEKVWDIDEMKVFGCGVPTTSVPCGITAPNFADVNTSVNFMAASAGSGATYTWDFGPNASPPSATGINASTTFTLAGEHRVYLTTKAGGCEVVCQHTINIQCVNFPTGSILGPDVVTVNVTEQYEFSPPGAYTYEWTFFGINEPCCPTTVGPHSATFNTVGSGSSVNVVVTDANGCSAAFNKPVTVNPAPACAVSFTVLQGNCNDNSTPFDPSDDYYIADVTVSYSGHPSTGDLVLTGDFTNGPHQWPVSSLPPSQYIFNNVHMPADGNTKSLTVTFSAEPSCTYTDSNIPAVASCSNSCQINIPTILTTCNNAGTPTNPNDDTFTYTINATGSGVGATYDISGGDTQTGLSYGTTEGPFGPFNISAGSFSITLTDVDDPGCTRTATVTPPTPCSNQCTINAPTINVDCNDNGTPSDPSDDVFEYSITVTGSNVGPTYSISGDDTQNFLPYGVQQGTFGPFPISGGNLNITITDDNDPTCSTTAVVTAPAPCSSSCTASQTNTPDCQDNGTPLDPNDDYFNLDVTGTIVNGSGNYEVVIGAYTSPSTPSGTPITIVGDGQSGNPSLLADGSATYSVTVQDAVNTACSTTFTVGPISPCSSTCPTVNNPINPNDPTICEGQAIPALTVSVGAGETVDWYAGTSGGSPLATGTTSYTPSIPSVQGVYDYYAEARDIATGCVSDFRTRVVLTIIEEPIVDPIGNVTMCGGDPFNIVFSGTSGATFDWTNSNPGIGLAPTGSGSITSGNAANVTSQQVATITVTPSLNGCTGAPENFTITVNPGPTLTITGASCDSGPGSTTYTIAFNSNGTVTSTAGTVVGNTVINVPIAQSALLTATLNGCTTNILVNPPNCTCPPIQPPTNPVNGVVCEGNPNPALSVTLGAGLQGFWYDAEVGGTLLASNTASYTPTETVSGVYEYFVEAQDGSGCVSASRTKVTLTINPTPVIDQLPNYEFCAGELTPVIPFTGTSGMFFGWDNDNTNIGLGASSGSSQNHLPSFTAANVTVTETATITVQGRFGNCPADNMFFDITVHPKPTLSVSGTQCSPDLQTYTITFNSSGTVTSTAGTVTGNTVTGIPSGTGVTLTATIGICDSLLSVAAPDCSCPVINPPSSPNNPEICEGASNPALTVTVGAGEAADWYASAVGGTALATGTTSYTPSDSAPGSYTYYAEARNTATNCTSDTRTAATLTIKAIPFVNPKNNITACAGSNISTIVFTGTSGATFNWTNDNTTIGLGASGSGNIAGFTLANVATQQVATITVTPTLDGCPGTPINFTITVNPLPSVDPIGNITVCVGQTVGPINFTGTSGATFNWTNDNTLVGLAPSGTGNIAVYTAPTVATQQTANIVVTPILNGCSGTTETFTITVNPLPEANPINNIEVCSGQTVGPINFGGTTGATFSWTNDNIAVGLAASGSGNITAYTTPSVSGTEVANISVTPSLNGCDGTPENFTITINPIPSPTVASSQSICQGNTFANLTASGATTYQWQNSTDNVVFNNISGANSSTYDPPETLGTTYYRVIGTTAGCQDFSSSVTLTLNSNPSPSVQSSQTICEGQSFTNLTASGANSYQWQNSSDDVTFNDISGAIAPSYNPPETLGVMYYRVVGTTSGCEGTSASVILEVNQAPTVNAVGDVTVCAGDNISDIVFTGTSGATFSWTNDNTAIGLGASGTGTISSFTAATLTVQEVATITVTPGLNGCTGASESFTITVNPNPSLNTSNIVCSGDLSTYSIDYTSDGTVTSTAGTVTATQVTGIPSGTNVTLTATLNGCTSTASVTAPDCSCPPVNPPANPNDPTICEGAATPALMVTVGSGETADWYSAASGGAALAGGTTSYTPGDTAPGAYTYYAETRNTTSGCVSATRTPVVLTINANPTVDPVDDATVCSGGAVSDIVFTGTSGATFSWANDNTAIGLGASGTGTISSFTAATLTVQEVATITVTPSLNGCTGASESFTITVNPNPSLNTSNIVCSGDLSTYSIDYTSDGTVTSTAGTVTATQVTDIPSGTNVTLTATLNGCTTTASITAPDCNCPTVNPPANPNGPTICEGATTPALTVTVGAGETADWYAAASGGAALASGTTSYTPSDTAPGGYTYYAEARNTTDGCVSSTRTPVVLTINANPTLTLVGTTCSGDLSTYTIDFASNGTVTSTAGTVSGNQVTDIPTGTDVTLTSTLNGCTAILAVNSPTCTANCPPVRCIPLTVTKQ